MFLNDRSKPIILQLGLSRKLFNNIQKFWYKDSGGLSSIKFIVYIKEQGPFEYLIGLANKNLEYKYIPRYIKENRNKTKKYSEKKGDILISDEIREWHKVTSEERNTLQIAYGPVSNKINSFFNYGSYLKD